MFPSCLSRLCNLVLNRPRDDPAFGPLDGAQVQQSNFVAEEPKGGQFLTSRELVSSFPSPDDGRINLKCIRQLLLGHPETAAGVSYSFVRQARLCFGVTAKEFDNLRNAANRRLRGSALPVLS